jgi:hypothetical protein
MAGRFSPSNPLISTIVEIVLYGYSSARFPRFFEDAGLLEADEKAHRSAAQHPHAKGSLVGDQPGRRTMSIRADERPLWLTF